MNELMCGLPRGTRDDLAARTSLAALAPFFGSDGAARRFVELAVLPYLIRPQPGGPPVSCVDVGGGEGIVAAALADMLAERNIASSIVVVDQNPDYVSTAARRGLSVVRGDASVLPASSADVAVLRFVNHYSDAQSQMRLAQDLARAVRRGGLLAAQIQTATDEICRLFGEIAALLSGDAAGEGRYWPTLPHFMDWFRAAGFEDVAVIGSEVEDRIDKTTMLQEAWNRVRGPALEAALRGGDVAATVDLLAARERLFWRQAQACLERAGQPDEIASIQPIIVMRRSAADRGLHSSEGSLLP